MDRYDRNKIFTPNEQKQLLDKRVCVIGCGGLGGYLIEMLTRIGIGHLTVIDGDVFSLSNLNRQLLSNESNIGTSKAVAAKRRIQSISSTTQITAIEIYLNAENAESILKGHDLIVDGLDDNGIRLMVQTAGKNLGIPMVYGAIAGWYGQVTTIMPGDDTLTHLCNPAQGKGIEEKIGNPSFTPACVASYQVAESIKVLLNKGEILSKKVLYLDLLTNEHEIISFV